MDRNKLTPCRRVGLSRKKITPCKTIERLLNTSVNITNHPTQNISTTVIDCLEEINTQKKLQSTERNQDTPCRQVGLSRKHVVLKKRKTSSKLIKDVGKKENVSSTSLATLINSPSIQNLPNSFISKDTIRNYHTKALPSKLSLQNTEHTNMKNTIDQNRSFLAVSDEEKEQILETTKVLHLSAKDKYSNHNKDKGNLSNHNKVNSISVKCQLNVDEIQDDKNFIKVCYNSKIDDSIKTDNYFNMRKCAEQDLKNYKDTHKILANDEEDDFEINPRNKESKVLFVRSKTEVPKKNMKKRDSREILKPLKKSLSTGNYKMTDISISSTDSLNNCFVKLKKLRSTQEQTCKTPQESSDDDFDIFTSTPKESKITNIEQLGKEVEGKRKILDDMKRAKLCKKLHNTTELKNLTLKWKNGCIIALNDLLKQLNTHTQMDMETLLKKLNMPHNFMPLSQ